MTPAELNDMIIGYTERVKHEFMLARYIAWWTAKLIWSKKIPNLSKVLEIKKEQKENKTLEEMRKEHREICERFLKGG